MAALNGADVIVFTAGIGENAIDVREQICSDLEGLGVEVSSERNQVRGEIQEISTQQSDVKVLVVPTNEELVIARDTEKLVK
jgi:acetate kinase